MRKSWLLCVLLGTLAWGQAAPSAPPPRPAETPAEEEATPQAPAAKAESVPLTAPVITINGVCEPKAAPKGTAAKSATAAKTPASNADCKTVITREQFEKLANSLAPNITPQQKKQLAAILPRFMAMSNAAKKEHLDETPQFREQVKFNRMQILAKQLQQKMQDDAAKVPDAQIEKYYKDHADSYEQYSLERLYIPRTKQEIEPKQEPEKDEKATEEQQKEKQDQEKTKAEENETAMTKLAGDLRTRAAAGEDFVKLQKEAYDASGMKIESPTVTLPNMRRSQLPPGHASVFDLKQGDVSQVISDAGGHYIYKLTGKSEMSLDQAKTEIKNKLQSDRMRESMEKINGSFKVDTNEAYFGAGGAMPPRPMAPRPGMGMQAPPRPQTPPPAQPPAAKPD